VRVTCDADSVQAASGGQDEAVAYLSAGLTEVARDETATGRTVNRMTRGRRADGAVTLAEESTEEVSEQSGDAPPELSVMASGCLGLISFPREPGRVTLERLEQLDQRRVEGVDPLAPYGAHAADHVRRTDGFPHCPDVVLNSTYWADADEVAAFEELVGSHGGMGGGQSFPFVLFPAELDWPEGDVIGSEQVHRIFRRWLAGLGQDAYADTDVDSLGSSTRTSTEGATAAT
jgi:hypothetical protein